MSISLNGVKNGAVVKVVKLPEERLREFGISEGSVIRVIQSIKDGPVVVGVDGRILVVDSRTASELLVVEIGR